MMIPDHPVIQNMERTGYPDGKEPDYPVCPVCSEPCETIYKNREMEIVGCNICIGEFDAYEETECFPDAE